MRHLVLCPALRVLANTNTSKGASDGILEARVEADFREEAATDTHRVKVPQGSGQLFASLCRRTIVPLNVTLAVGVDI